MLFEHGDPIVGGFSQRQVTFRLGGPYVSERAVELGGFVAEPEPRN